jgi:hypothetical protein
VRGEAWTLLLRGVPGLFRALTLPLDGDEQRLSRLFLPRPVSLAVSRTFEPREVVSRLVSSPPSAACGRCCKWMGSVLHTGLVR